MVNNLHVLVANRLSKSQHCAPVARRPMVSGVYYKEHSQHVFILFVLRKTENVSSLFINLNCLC